jgi:hypothetical protein
MSDNYHNYQDTRNSIFKKFASGDLRLETNDLLGCDVPYSKKNRPTCQAIAQCLDPAWFSMRQHRRCWLQALSIRNKRCKDRSFRGKLQKQQAPSKSGCLKVHSDCVRRRTTYYAEIKAILIRTTSSVDFDAGRRIMSYYVVRRRRTPPQQRHTTSYAVWMNLNGCWYRVEEWWSARGYRFQQINRLSAIPFHVNFACQHVLRLELLVRTYCRL